MAGANGGTCAHCCNYPVGNCSARNHPGVGTMCNPIVIVSGAPADFFRRASFAGRGGRRVKSLPRAKLRGSMHF